MRLWLSCNVLDAYGNPLKLKGKDDTGVKRLTVILFA